MNKKIIISLTIILIVVIAIGIIIQVVNMKKNEPIVKWQLEKPEYIIYQINGEIICEMRKSEKTALYAIPGEINEAIFEDFQLGKNNVHYVPVEIENIKEEIYLQNSVLRMFYNNDIEIDIILDSSPREFNLIYINGNDKECYKAFEMEKSNMDELKEFIEKIADISNV